MELCEDERLISGYTACRLISRRFFAVAAHRHAMDKKVGTELAQVCGTAQDQSDILHERDHISHISLGVVTSLGNFTCLELLLRYSNVSEACGSRCYPDGRKFRAIWIATYLSHCKALRLVTHASNITVQIPAHCVLAGEWSHVLESLLSDYNGLDMYPLVILIYVAEIRVLEFLVARGASLEMIMALSNKGS